MKVIRYIGAVAFTLVTIVPFVLIMFYGIAIPLMIGIVLATLIPKTKPFLDLVTRISATIQDQWTGIIFAIEP